MLRFGDRHFPSERPLVYSLPDSCDRLDAETALRHDPDLLRPIPPTLAKEEERLWSYPNVGRESTQSRLQDAYLGSSLPYTGEPAMVSHGEIYYLSTLSMLPSYRSRVNPTQCRHPPLASTGPDYELNRNGTPSTRDWFTLSTDGPLRLCLPSTTAFTTVRFPIVDTSDPKRTLAYTTRTTVSPQLVGIIPE